jgi:hypothetical protein
VRDDTEENRRPIMHRVAAHSLAALLGASLLVPFSAEAQVSLGVSAGASVASFEGDDVPDGLDTRSSFNAGIFLGVPLGGRFTLVPGIYYVEKGSRSSSDDLETKLNYVELPLLLSLGLFESGTYALDVFAGPSLAFEVQCFQEVTFRSEGLEDTGPVECRNLETPLETTGLDLGAVFGAGLTFYLTRRVSAVVHGGLDLGLSNIDDWPEELDRKNSTWFLNAGIAWTPGEGR